jgi:multidrug efflux system outer membrane protein
MRDLWRFLARVFPGIALVLAGCGPDVSMPPARISLPGQYSRMAPVPVPGADQVAWWRGFHDPVLDVLVARGLAENVSIKIAEARLREAEADARAAGNVVSDTLSASVEQTRGSRTGLGGLSLSLAPFGGRHRHAAEAAMARLEAARYGQENARLQLLAQLTQAYVDLRFYQAQQRQQQRDLASRRQTLASLVRQMDLGAATRLDLLSAEALVAETEARIPQLNASIARQANMIATLLGTPAGALGISLEYPGRQPALEAPRRLGIPADLVRRRSDIRQAEALYAAALAEMGQARAAFYPSLSLSGQITAPLDSALSSSQALTVGLSLPLLSLPRVQAEADAAQARAEQAYLAWRLGVLSAVEDVESGLAAVAGSRLAARRAERVVALNAEALDLSRKLLDSRGDMTALDLLDRERAVSQARASLAQSQRDYASDTIALYVALGLGPDPEQP